MRKIFILLIILAGCGRITPVEEYEENLVVHSFLCPNFEQQKVFVDRTYRLSEAASDTFAISGANCKLWKDNGDTVELVEEVSGVYITPGGWKLEPKNTYKLEISFEDYVVRASATVPDTFSILSICNNDTVYLANPPPFIWSESEEAKFYLLYPLVSGDTTTSVVPFVTFSTFLPLFSQ